LVTPTLPAHGEFVAGNVEAEQKLILH
jgi:hypothetical protein